MIQRGDCDVDAVKWASDKDTVAARLAKLVKGHLGERQCLRHAVRSREGRGGEEGRSALKEFDRHGSAGDEEEVQSGQCRPTTLVQRITRRHHGPHGRRGCPREGAAHGGRGVGEGTGRQGARIGQIHVGDSRGDAERRPQHRPRSERRHECVFGTDRVGTAQGIAQVREPCVRVDDSLGGSGRTRCEGHQRIGVTRGH